MRFAVVVCALVLSSCRPPPKADPHHVVCFTQGAQLVQTQQGAVYKPAFELDAIEDPASFDDVELVLVTGQTVHVHSGTGLCYAVPLSAVHASEPPPSPAADAGPSHEGHR